MAKPKTYREWLQRQDYEVTREELAGHRNFLTVVMPITKDLTLLLNKHAGHWDFPTSKFSGAEQKVLEQAVRILKGAEVPRALLSVKEEDPVILLGTDYDRRSQKQS